VAVTGPFSFGADSGWGVGPHTRNNKTGVHCIVVGSKCDKEGGSGDS